MIWGALTLSCLLALSLAVLSVIILSWSIWAAFALYVLAGSTTTLLAVSTLYFSSHDSVE